MSVSCEETASDFCASPDPGPESESDPSLFVFAHGPVKLSENAVSLFSEEFDSCSCPFYQQIKCCPEDKCSYKQKTIWSRKYELTAGFVDVVHDCVH